MRVVALSLGFLTGLGGLSIELSTTQAGARPVTMTLRLRAELQCGSAAGPPIAVSFAAAERVPGRIAAAHVLVDGRAAEAVAVVGHHVTVSVSKPAGVICDVIAPGPIRIVFTRAAGLGNPARPGRYIVTVRRGALTVSGAVTIR